MLISSMHCGHWNLGCVFTRGSVPTASHTALGCSQALVLDSLVDVADLARASAVCVCWREIVKTGALSVDEAAASSLAA